MASVRLEGITKQWNSSHGLQNIDIDISDGELLVLVGPSGCGKSTILRLIAGLEIPTTGNLFIADRLVNDVPARQRDVAMVFQNYALYPHMTVAENLGFGLKMRRIEDNLRREQVQKVAKSLGLENLLHRKPSQLSGGQQQRVALGRAIVRQPQVFLLDEPLSNLDAQLRDSTRAELKLLHRQLATTMVYVTHDQTEAMTLADRMVVLNYGQIQQIDTPTNIYNNPANEMVAKFIGNPPMNILPTVFTGELLQLGGQTIAIPGDLTDLSPGQTVHLGIRPEHLHFTPTDRDLSLQVTVILEELLGAEKLIHCCIQGFPDLPLLLKVKDENLTDRVYFAPDRVYLFDCVTGKNLSLS